MASNDEATTSHVAEGDEDLRRFGCRIAELRKRKGWTQKELARRAGLDSTRLSRIETCRVVMSLNDLLKLRRALAIDLEQLLFERAEAGHERSARLVRDIEKLGSGEELRVVFGLLDYLVVGYRCRTGRNALGDSGELC
jgi:transcriptional regulator with XRE-family HTH domain